MCVCIDVSLHLYVYGCMYVTMYVCMCASIYVSIHCMKTRIRIESIFFVEKALCIARFAKIIAKPALQNTSKFSVAM